VQLRVTTLAENTATKMGTLAEHGLSMLVEVDDLCLLLDAGQTDTVVHNFFFNNVDTVTEW
jgi:metal-dependent hydrolase (beta-lactamase superfamily II)